MFIAISEALKFLTIVHFDLKSVQIDKKMVYKIRALKNPKVDSYEFKSLSERGHSLHFSPLLPRNALTCTRSW